eukprot:TRINITY_DN6655_c0_g1_i5.p1 TRINITY_DN6655_c0_g1~~TRINITY_DN6655_c0_g1_i5.p1  ORF type:complete len:301 (+),score=41.90 TRINITY_DN6655_c0_g1_i5:2168-3070(+)
MLISKSTASSFDSLEISIPSESSTIPLEGPRGMDFEKDFNVVVEDVPIADGESVQYIFASSNSTEKLPLIMAIHGGPHYAFVNKFSRDVFFFLLAGFHVMSVNYRGSTGFGNHFLNSLPGHCGDYDVQDCMASLTHVLSKCGDIIDSERIFSFGGSHGGFVSTHLFAREKRVKAGVIRNPVVDISQMVLATDIPDWCYTECCQKSYTASALQVMFTASPFQYIDQVKIPVLVVLGAKDKRVPPLQGWNYYLELKARGVKTRLLIYPDSGHAIENPQYVSDFLINAVLWFMEAQNEFSIKK